MANLAPAVSYQINNASLMIGPNLVGTKGSFTFNPNNEIRNIATEEGYPSPIQGYHRIISWNATLVGECTQLDSGSWPAIYEKGSTVTGTDVLPYKANLFYTAGTYHSGIAVFGTLGDSSRFAVQFPLGLVTDYEWSGDAKAEGAVKCTFTAVLTTTQAALDKNVAPYKITLNY